MIPLLLLILTNLVIVSLSNPIKNGRTNEFYSNSSQENWFDKLLFNLFGYTILLFPAFFTVLMVKKNLCFPFGMTHL